MQMNKIRRIKKNSILTCVQNNNKVYNNDSYNCI